MNLTRSSDSDLNSRSSKKLLTMINDGPALPFHIISIKDFSREIIEYYFSIASYLEHAPRRCFNDLILYGSVILSAKHKNQAKFRGSYARSRRASHGVFRSKHNKSGWVL